MGFIKGVPYEFPASNQNPVGVMDRFWEAHDFILKAMTSHDEPFNWEGEYFHYRQVNVWPRPVQQPHPPVWTTTGNKAQARLLGEKGYVMATLGSGYATRPLYDAYRAGYLAKWKKPAPADRFAYLGLVAVADDEAEARRRGELVAGLSALIGDRARAVPQSAGLPLGRGQRAHAARPERAAQLHQGRPRRSTCTTAACRT